MKRILIISIILLSPLSRAQEPSWQVLPDTCVVQKMGELCEMSVEITTENLPNETYCLNLDGQALDCWLAAETSLQTVLSYRQALLLGLEDPHHNIVLSLQLKIKALQSNRRRLRSPWSIF
ncbi:DUF3019 domain-containing protein [Alteromonadaceae bacterium BrNp21-10]|nr:DUF3019 domain-containing protein [Alteromonadaceae bacterium BrNp21-10]